MRMFGSAAGRRPVFVSGAWREMEKILSLFRFMRKTRSERQSGVKEFYYLGPIHSTGRERAKEIFMANGTMAVD